MPQLLFKVAIGLDESSSEAVIADFKEATTEISEIITRITGGVTWRLCKGTWKLSAVPRNKIFPFEGPTEHDITAVYEFSAPSSFQDAIFDCLHNEVSAAIRKFDLPINHVHVEKTTDITTHHFELQ